MSVVIRVLAVVLSLGALVAWQLFAPGSLIDHPLGVFIAGIVALIAAFSKKVWKRVEGELTERSAAWILRVSRQFSPGYSRRLRRRITTDLSHINLRGMGLINTFSLTLQQVFVPLRLAPSRDPTTASVDPLRQASGAGGLPVLGSSSIWGFLRGYQIQGPRGDIIAIIGPPGSGKTTLLQHIGLIFAEDKQGNRLRSRRGVTIECLWNLL